jgi:branched-chain amino acid transport system ATP-binding protein
VVYTLERQLGVTIVLVEQNARMALRLAKNAFVMEVGKITLEGAVKDIANDKNVVKAYLGG